MPTWWEMWCQVRAGPPAPTRVSSSASLCRTPCTRAETWRSSSSQRFRSSGSPSTLAAIRAPWSGGEEYMGRTIRCFSCDITAAASEAELQTRLKAPTLSPYRPIDLAYEVQTMGRNPAPTKARTAYASLSGSPVAKPWYAESKTGRSPRSANTFAMASHCARVGSMPVGLCAHACNNTLAPGGTIELRSANIRSKSNPTPLSSK
mmetsp:Transcript_23912/g.66475  ORF Transcript_23912/g.66475 Transcript_23912/m.66475 type:complete len:205 (-) Transcript_23912:520-1134(-)